MSIDFVKYHGLGNDFVLIDNRCSLTPLVTPQQAMQLCDRHFGIGADGVIFALPGQQGSDYSMRIFNADGSEPEMCGNGIRCLAQYLIDLEGKSGQTIVYRIDTLAGIITPQVMSDGQVRVGMGMPRLLAAEIPTTLNTDANKVIDQPLKIGDQTWLVTCVSMGNPHCITFVEDLASIPVDKIGPLFEHHPAFPQRTNTEFIQVVQPNYLKMRVWERGAGATLACGTGACASLVAAVLTGRAERRAIVELPGGSLEIHWSEVDQQLYMTGPAQKVFAGTVELESLVHLLQSSF